MTIAQIKYFTTVAKCLSFTKAAEQLFLSQPALSRHIRNMEEELNIQLFVRTNTGIRLTPAGSTLYLGMEDLYNTYIGLVENASKVQQGHSGILNVGVLEETNTADFLPRVYHALTKEFPSVELRLHTGSFDFLTSNLYSGKLDVMFNLQFEVAQKESILYQYVSHSKDHIVMSKYHPLAKKERITLEDVRGETFVMISPEDNPESSPLIFAICKEHGFVPQVHYAKTLGEQILWITAGMGVSILDSRSNLKLNSDVKFYEMESNWDPSLVVAWNQNNYNPLISVFLKKLNEVLGLADEDVHGFSLEG